MSEKVEKKRIVIIDMDGEWCRVMDAMCAFCGCESFSASSGEAGIDLLRKMRSDALLIDIMVNYDSLAGLYVLRQLKADPQLRHIPVAMLSADYLQRGKQEALDMGALMYIKKEEINYRLGRLLEMIKADASGQTDKPISEE